MIYRSTMGEPEAAQEHPQSAAQIECPASSRIGQLQQMVRNKLFRTLRIILISLVLPDQPVSIATIKSKRLHALFELLDTERAYSNDMTLVKSVHLPLALGLKADFGPLGVPAEGQIPSNTSLGSIASTDSTIYRSSGISATTTAVSLSQTATSGTANEPPMTVEDAKVIFANLDELAEFAGRFTEQIQSSLGSLIEGGHGLDSIGTLFLQTVSLIPLPFYATERFFLATDHDSFV